ncbi:MAG: RNA polymerase sigma factor, partial [Gemmatimonadales bacterium]
MTSPRLTKHPARGAVKEIATDPAVLEEFYRAHIEEVKRFVARRIDEPYLVADLTADVFVAAIDSASTYDQAKGGPTAWLWG